MTFYSVRDLRNDSKKMWSELNDGGEIILTNTGKPSALMVNISDGNFEEMVRAVRQAKAMIALNTARKRAADIGFMNDDEIESVINEARGGKDECSA